MQTFQLYDVSRVIEKSHNTAICPDIKWWGFHISEPMRNPDHLQTISTIQNLDMTGFQIPHCTKLFEVQTALEHLNTTVSGLGSQFYSTAEF